MLKITCFTLVIFINISAALPACPTGQKSFIHTAEDGYTITMGCLKYYGEEKGWLMEGVVRTQTDAQQILTTSTTGKITGNIQAIGTIDGSFSGAFRGINMIIFQSGSMGGTLNGNTSTSSKVYLEANSISTTTPTYSKGLIVEASYHEGQLDGVTRTYKTNIYRQKTLFEERSYKADQLNGNYVGYNDMQIPETTGYFVNGQKTGEWKFYDKNGVIHTRGSYLSDKKNGTWTSVNPMEFPIFEYSNSLKEKTKSFEVDFVEGQPNGHFVVYGAKHFKLTEGSFVDGKMSGAWSFYSDNETLATQCNYSQGKKIDSSWKTYSNGEMYDIVKIISKTAVKIRMKRFSVPYNGRNWYNANATIHIKDLNNSKSISGNEIISIDENDFYEPTENQSPWVNLKLVNGIASFEASITSGGITPIKQNLTYSLGSGFDEKGNIVIHTTSVNFSELKDDKKIHSKGYLCKQIDYSSVAINFRGYNAIRGYLLDLTWSDFFCARKYYDFSQYIDFDIKIVPPQNIDVPIKIGS